MKFRLLALLVLAGCSTLKAEQFDRPNTTAQQRADDGEYCSTYADAKKGSTPHGGIAGIADINEKRNALFKLCMMDRGYRVSARPPS